MSTVLDKEFFLEQFRRVHDEFRRVHDRLEGVETRLRRLTDEFHIFRERSDTQHREISNLYATIVEHDRRMDGNDRRIEKIERRLELDQPEH
ncbi:MAG: hypothetical protein C0519_04610 [Hyphomicrobium sp.]|nr:hypothetical protein [Hyphomicrobium sp.]